MNPGPPNTSGCPLHFSVSCPAEKSLLKILRRFISSVAEDMGFSQEDICKIEMAVDEACTNALIHPDRPDSAGMDPVPHCMDLKVSLEPHRLTIQIDDYGNRPNPKTKYLGSNDIDEYSDPERSCYHGLGILIMKQFMDEVSFRNHEESGTSVVLRKYLRTHTHPENKEA